MQPTTATDVYFALDGQGAVTAIKINEGEIIERKVLSETQLSPSWVNALHEMRASMETNPIEPCGISFPQQHGSRALRLDRTRFAASDREHEPVAPYMQGLLQPCLDSTLPLEAGVRTANSGVESPFDIPGLSDTWDDVDLFNLSCVPVLVENAPIDHVSRDSNIRDPRTDGGCESRPMGLKRAQKLHRMLHALENLPIVSREDHNRLIEALYNGPQLLTCSQDVSMVQFAAVLGRHSSVSAAVGTIYGLLSWKIFGLEEDRLIKEERMSPYIASKQMNQKMTSALRRRGKSNDWASDGRRAAKAVFGALEGVGIQEQSFALILLADDFGTWPVAAAMAVLFIGKCLLSIYWHPLSRFPGPKLALIGPFCEFYYDVIKDGTFLWEIEKMHQKYGPIVRINTRELHIRDSEFYSQIYAGNSRRIDKDAPTVQAFSVPTSVAATVDHYHHRARRGYLNQYFSKRSVGDLEPIIQERVDRLCGRFECALQTHRR
ncbi:hypothetical protein Aspvir_009485 [Aspergillus viridinutans]|uniref:Uncharacterized protein n=1 Tax=Aspergillus viridinutans TaxID=75553 RepID=A0A9P3C559_ASPVI|nr:uncharacterized protein Aspvir_009485 [Aspergillus viridinutans]GIK05376.1 hypothetical protein Aspvir_009485 [Aspergillus viridinutans]